MAWIVSRVIEVLL